MKTVCELYKCDGCMACVDICPRDAIDILDSLDACHAIIKEEQCVNCGICHRVCQRNHPAKAVAPQYWYQGWANNSDIRSNGSSGGLAMAIAAAFIDHGGMVCSCVFNHGVFGFKMATVVSELHQYSGSKYVKSNPAGVYRTIQEALTCGSKVLFIGLPCQVAALKNYIGTRQTDYLYTIDLICHGTPSPKVLDTFLKQYKLSLKTIKDIRFRVKDQFQISEDYKGLATTGIKDRYTIAFLKSLIYTNNCYECNYAKRERVSDLTLGDSWGTTLASDEWNKGISLVLCQNDKGTRLLEQTDLHLESLDIDNAVANNHQLRHPSDKPVGWDKFFKGLKAGKKFNYLVFKYCPKQCLRQVVKQILIGMKIPGGGLK